MENVLEAAMLKLYPEVTVLPVHLIHKPMINWNEEREECREGERYGFYFSKHHSQPARDAWDVAHSRWCRWSKHGYTLLSTALPSVVVAKLTGPTSRSYRG